MDENNFKDIDKLKDELSRFLETIKKNIDNLSLEDLTMLNVIVSNKINNIIWKEVKDGKR